MRDDVIIKAYKRNPDSVKQPYKGLIERIGIDHLLVIAEELGGFNMYIRSKKRMFQGCIAEAIRDEYNGSNQKQLADKYGYTVNGINNILIKGGKL